MPTKSFDAKEWKERLVERKEDVQIGGKDGNSLILRAGSNTDWWRSAKGSIPESGVNRHNGPLYVFDVPESTTSWTASVWIGVDHKERFQQATLFVGVGDYIDGKDPWLKAGVEIEHEEQNIGSVVAAPISDWTLFASPKVISLADQWLYIEAKRTGADVILSYGLGQPADVPPQLHLMREIKGFAVQPRADLASPWQIGVMTCGPKSASTESQFRQFTFDKEENGSL